MNEISEWASSILNQNEIIQIEDIRGFLEADPATDNDIQLFESAKRGQPEIKLEKLDTPSQTPPQVVDDNKEDKLKEESSQSIKLEQGSI